MTPAQRRDAAGALISAGTRMAAAAYALDQCDDCPECAVHAAELRGAIEMIDDWLVAIEQKKARELG